MSCPKCGEVDADYIRDWSKEKGFRWICVCNNEECKAKYERITEFVFSYKLLEGE